MTDTNLERANISNLRGGLERDRNNVVVGGGGAGDNWYYWLMNFY